MKGHATHIRVLTGFTGDARLYRVEPPVEFEDRDGTTKLTDHVVVSATAVLRPETYIFPASSAGKVLDWLELEGSFQGGLDHEHALNRAGYSVRYEESA